MSHELNLFEIEQVVPEKSPKSYPSPKKSLPPPTAFVENQLQFQLKRLIEALLFASSTPVSFEKLRQVVDSMHVLKPRMLRTLILELQHEYLSQRRAFRLEEIAQGFILRTCEEFGPYIDHLTTGRRGEKLSNAAAEVLAIIAYRQPVTRPQIDAIRGVDSSGTIQNLLERQLIEVVGKQETAGRPSLYGITKLFLEHFGLRSLQELPPLHYN